MELASCSSGMQILVGSQLLRNRESVHGKMREKEQTGEERGRVDCRRDEREGGVMGWGRERGVGREGRWMEGEGRREKVLVLPGGSALACCSKSQCQG